MAKIDKNDFQGGSNLNLGHGNKPLAKTLQDMADDFETIRAQLAALHAKLDADVGVTDTNYASTLDIAASGIKTKKGLT